MGSGVLSYYQAGSPATPQRVRLVQSCCVAPFMPSLPRPLPVRSSLPPTRRWPSCPSAARCAAYSVGVCSSSRQPCLNRSRAPLCALSCSAATRRLPLSSTCPSLCALLGTPPLPPPTPHCAQVEVRLGHRRLFELALDFIGVSREARGSVIQLLSTAAGASPLHATARSKRWPSIKAGTLVAVGGRGGGRGGCACTHSQSSVLSNRLRRLCCGSAVWMQLLLCTSDTRLQSVVTCLQAWRALGSVRRPSAAAASWCCRCMVPAEMQKGSWWLCKPSSVALCRLR